MRMLVATTAIALALLPAANLAQAATTVDTGSQLTASSPVPSTEVDRQATTTKRANMNDIQMMLASKCPTGKGCCRTAVC